MSFMKKFFSIFNCMSPMEEKLDDTIQDLYDRMNWGNYCSNYNCLLEVQEKKYHNVFVKDPARPRKTFYERKYYEK